VVRIGGSDPAAGLDVQVRCMPSINLAIVEVLFVWRYGRVLERALSSDVVGYRLDFKDEVLREDSRWLFEYWPPRYEAFRTDPLRAAEDELSRGNEIVVVSADFANFYDTVDPRFMGSDEFLTELELTTAERRADYQAVIASWLRLNERFRARAARLTGVSWNTGIPIGPISSRIVANLALATLDKEIAIARGVVCYRRYVDDIVIVGRAESDDRMTLDQAIRSFIPAVRSGISSYDLDNVRLKRPGCTFSLQKSKIRVHRLAGRNGRTFVRSVANDLRKTVSERRAFVDPAVFADDAARRLIRTAKGGASPLRVLREADRATLERFSLATMLRSLERISCLVDVDDARGLIRQNVVDVIRVLDSEDDWVENLELVFELLRLSLATEDDSSAADLISRTTGLWGSVNRLKERVRQLFHRGRPITRERAWERLRDYLHERRLEDVVVAVRPGSIMGASWLARGLPYRSGLVGRRALLRRTRLFAAADLRMRDREDDQFGENSALSNDAESLTEISQADPLRERMSEIGTFVNSLSQRSPWRMSPARLFLCTRPPSYFDIARRMFSAVTEQGFEQDLFQRVLSVVNSIRGTRYSDPSGEVVDGATVVIPRGLGASIETDLTDPRIVLSNVVASDSMWEGAATFVPGSSVGRPVRSLSRFKAIMGTLRQADAAARRWSISGRVRPPTLVVMPELSLPRAWFREVATYVVRSNRHGLIVGLEYKHLPGFAVENQVHAVFPGPWRSVVTFSWRKGYPAREEARLLASRPTPLTFGDLQSRTGRAPRTVVRSIYGDISILICSELLEATRVSELLGRVEMVLVPSWNPDTSSYEHLIQSAGLHLNAIVAIANNGHYSDCRAWAPIETRWRRDLCRLIERDVDSIVTVEVPLAALRGFRSGQADGWRPLPPEWP